MSLNGSLAGLVAITASCASVDALGAAIIGLVAGFLIVFAVEFIDLKLHVDDPVGAIAVHGANGIWGGLAVSLFATTSVPGSTVNGLFYGSGWTQLGTQALGILAIASWTIVVTVILFLVIKKTNGLRVSAEEEIQGLDLPEHGLASAYGDFMIAVPLADMGEAAVPSGAVPADVAVSVVNNAHPDAKMTKITIITNQNKFSVLQSALDSIGITGITVTNVMGYGIQKGHPVKYRGVEMETKLLPKVQVDIVICKVPTDVLVSTVKKALYTGNVGDGKKFVFDVENVIKVRTGEEGYAALQDD